MSVEVNLILFCLEMSLEPFVLLGASPAAGHIQQFGHNRGCFMFRFTKLLTLVLCLALLTGVGTALYSSSVAAQSVIETQIDGEFEGWEGETVVKLMNGQVWIQTEYYYEYHYAYMPDVLIYNSGGGWKMRVEGINKAIGVEQLR